MLFDQNWLCQYPRPSAVIYDNGSEFSSKFEELLESYGILPRLSTVKNPQTNSIVERSHQVIADALRSMELNKRPFDETSASAILAAVAWGLRSTYHSVLRASPGQVIFGRDMVINAAYAANWKIINDRRAKQTISNNTRKNSKRIEHTYRRDDQVYIIVDEKAQKLRNKQGPFKITTVHTNGTVTIRRSANVTERINIRRLHPAFL